MTRQLPVTDSWTIVDVQATPSGYYEISFRERATGNTVTATQHGRGGSNIYYPYSHSPQFETFRAWLKTNEHLAIDYLNHIEFPDLAKAVNEHEGEWEDTVVMCFVDWVEMGVIRVAG